MNKQKSGFVNKGTILILFILLIGSVIGAISSINFNIFLYLSILLIFIFLVFKWELTIYLLIIAVTFNGYIIPIGTVDIRPDNLICILSIISFIAYLLTSRKTKLYLHLPEILFCIFLIYLSITTFFTSPILSISIKGIIQFILVFLSFIVMVQLKNLSKEELYKFINFYIIIAFLQSLYGIVSFMLYTAFSLDIGGIQFGQVGSSVTINGTFFEANLLGSFLSSSALLVLSLLVSKTHVKYQKLLIICLITLIIGLFLSWTRSSWIGFIICGIFIAVYYKSQFINIKNIFIALILTFILGPVFVYLTRTFDIVSGREGFFLTKLTGLFDFETGTGRYRLDRYVLAINDWSQHPLIGNGYFSIKKYDENEWIANTILTILHDAGLIGLVLFLLTFLIVLYKAHILIIKNKIGKVDRAYLVGLYVGLIQLLFSYNFTPGHTMAYFWVYSGLIYVFVLKLNSTQNKGEKIKADRYE
ncbi:O-antigen ligase family protein [Bacillus sp. ISL-46]|uniref:O-antigen ligase family protein n=1 Tax=Bacillus sp. ISL-46 TaxID=2819129 RepID=UPI001BE560AA|nr:O-antigen ligase family protein [Bacillus sp. ISL-46]MBT2724006.1 O-antigen ligase family protein [Bacillus sp. ISL-46]